MDGIQMVLDFLAMLYRMETLMLGYSTPSTVVITDAEFHGLLLQHSLISTDSQ